MLATRGAGSQEGRQETTTNYEVSKTVRTLIREQPQIERISLAVMVDGASSVGADGKQAWNDAQRKSLIGSCSLVKSAIGYDEKRGDHVEVVSMRFTADLTSTICWRTMASSASELDKADLLRLAQTALFGFYRRPGVAGCAATHGPADNLGHASSHNRSRRL